ncbi:MAG: hypothetical protein JXR19_11760 [Bacteroidia bacterium]
MAKNILLFFTAPIAQEKYRFTFAAALGITFYEALKKEESFSRNVAQINIKITFAAL